MLQVDNDVLITMKELGMLLGKTQANAANMVHRHNWSHIRIAGKMYISKKYLELKVPVKLDYSKLS
jgi:hypothetical protein